MLAKRAVHVSPADANHPGIRRDLAAAQPGRRRRAVLAAHLAQIAAQVLDTPSSTIDPDAPLATLGLTSVGMLELRALLERSLEVTLPVTLGWQFPTLDALVPYLAERMGIDLDPAQVARLAVLDQPIEPVPSPAGPLERDDVVLDELSDAELAALLMARIDLMEDAEAR